MIGLIYHSGDLQYIDASKLDINVLSRVDCLGCCQYLAQVLI